MKGWILTKYGIFDGGPEEPIVVCTTRPDGQYISLLLAAPELLEGCKAAPDNSPRGRFLRRMLEDVITKAEKH